MGDKRIGVSDNFLEVGGNSIILTQIHKEIDMVFPDKLVVTDLFAYPTIAKLASHIDNDKIIRLKTLTMPMDYMNDINTNEEIKSFKFDIKGYIHKNLERIAHQENIELHDLCLGLYVYLLSQVTGSKDVTLQTMIDDYDTVKPLRIDLSKYSNLNEIFRFREKESEYSQTSIHYTLEEINSVKMSKAETEMILFFFRKDLLKSNNDLHSIYDLIVQIEVQEDKIAVKYEYDCGKFKVDKLNEMFGNYIKLVNLLIEKYR